MSTVTVLTIGGFSQSIDRVAIECPFCHSKMAPDYLFLDNGSLFAKCSNSECGRHMVLTQGSFGDFKIISPNALPEKRFLARLFVKYLRISKRYTIKLFMLNSCHSIRFVE